MLVSAALYSIALSQCLHSTTYSAHTLAGSDYVVNWQCSNSTKFTVTFLSKQANSTEYVIRIADDHIFEGREYFRFQLSAIRPTGQAADFYVPQDGFENTFVDISIEDDDSKSGSSSCANYRIAYYPNDVVLTSQEILLVVVRVNFTTSVTISVTEGAW